ncbi:MAG: hypothetical protein UR89_C0009G0011 [Candidatus Roizmanbacteria bacterium GW2011_GWA2_35_8]|uniref:Glycosyltransferase RgtA/B/C/D-like domain-containing protein n=1 Tax=Candidatus Roizmanbacteria bacterium GW2011_GWA2_35_8 TaxID=1618479 RepID=A0A0G0FHN0_9BACT|nr:MAG: hypothetical protein UR89_C0009G0011 [Candidatus Roizmanbacteria bacterium GW2011_GWA2_35_8]
MKFKNFLIVFLLVIISSVLIFFKFNSIPKYLAYDEVEFAKLALSLDNKPYIPYSNLATGHSTLYFYIILFFIKVFGITTFALRLPAAIFGILNSVIFYLILKLIFQKDKILDTKYLILNTLILLTSRWFLNFSRFAFETTFLLFLELMSIYYVLLYIRLRGAAKVHSWSVLAFSGLFAGLAFNSYTPGRIFFVLPLFFLFKSVVPLIRNSKIKLIKILLCFLVPFIVSITPLAISFITNEDARIDQLFFWRNHEMTIGQKVAGTFQNVSTISQMFFIKGDMNGKHNYPGKPAINPILGILFIIGLVIAIKKYKNIYNQMFLIYFFISAFPSLAIYPWENPSMLRTFTVLPSIFYFIILSMHNTFTIGKMVVKKELYFFGIILIIFIISSTYELRTYFKYQSAVFTQAFEIRLPLGKAIHMQNIYEKNK